MLVIRGLHLMFDSCPVHPCILLCLVSCSTTISKVIGSVWSSNGSLLAGPFEGVAQPDSDTLNPAYMCTATLGSSQNGTRFEDPTATLMLQVRSSLEQYHLLGCVL